MDECTFEYTNHETAETEHNMLAARPPFVAAVSPEDEMIALGYREGTICLWEVQSQELIGFARDEENRCAATLLFNPNPNISMLLVIYLNPGLSLTIHGVERSTTATTCLITWAYSQHRVLQMAER